MASGHSGTWAGIEVQTAESKANKSRNLIRSDLFITMLLMFLCLWDKLPADRNFSGRLLTVNGVLAAMKKA
jgi:hypothetical protein